MSSASWGDYAEDPFLARLVRSSAVGNLVWGAFVVVVIFAIVVAAFAAQGASWLNCAAIG